MSPGFIMRKLLRRGHINLRSPSLAGHARNLGAITYLINFWFHCFSGRLFSRDRKLSFPTDQVKPLLLITVYSVFALQRPSLRNGGIFPEDEQKVLNYTLKSYTRGKNLNLLKVSVLVLNSVNKKKPYQLKTARQIEAQI